MTMSVDDFAPSMDPLLRDAHPVHSVVLSILGIRTRFSTNSASVAGLVDELRDRWHSGPVDESPLDELVIRIVVRSGREGGDGRVDVRHISTPDGRLLIQSPQSIGIVDPLRHDAIAYVTSELVADRAHFQTRVLEAMTFALLAGHDRHPIHAAAVGNVDRALLLAGESGAGKSTLAFLAHTHGMPLLSEDRVWVGLEPSLRIWSVPSAVHLRPEALVHFPVLRGPREVADATSKVAVDVTSRNARLTEPARRAAVCVLAHGGVASLTRLDGPTLVTELQRQTAEGFDRFPDRHTRVLEAISEGGGWRLTLSPSANDALPHLKHMLGES